MKPLIYGFNNKSKTRYTILIFYPYICFHITDGSEKLSDNSPGAASISSVDIANEFASLSHEEQDRLRAEWSQVIEINLFSNKLFILPIFTNFFYS